jgi:proline dehydrogenase
MPFFRDALLALSINPAAHRFVVGFPLARKVTRRFVAGETLDQAIGVVRNVNANGLLATLDYLGEAVTNEAEARRARDEYLRILDAIAQNGLNAYASLKPTHMGLVLGAELCYDNIRSILLNARDSGTLIRVEAEDSPHTDATLEIFRRLRAEFTNVGAVIQSMLYRSEADLQSLYAIGANVRLVKGAYKEPPEAAFPQKKDTDANYLKLAEMYLREPSAPPGVKLALATHDAKIIDWAKQYIREHNVAYERFEFQMLYGIRSDLQRQLAAEGYPMRVYIPYGSHWYPYFMRRLAERPANVIFLVSNLFK